MSILPDWSGRYKQIGWVSSLGVVFRLIAAVAAWAGVVFGCGGAFSRLGGGLVGGGLDDHGYGGAGGGNEVGVVFPFEGFVGVAGELGDVDHGQIEVDDADDVAGEVGSVSAIGEESGAVEDPGERGHFLLCFGGSHEAVGGYGFGLAVKSILAGDFEAWAGGRVPHLSGVIEVDGLAGLEAEGEEAEVDRGGASVGAEDGFVFLSAAKDAEKFEGHVGIECFAIDADLLVFEVDQDVG
jgi:hypothetical protein